MYDFLDWVNFSSRKADLKILKELRKNGIVMIPGYYSEEQCKELTQKVEQLLSDYKDKSWTDSTQSDSRIFGAELASDEVKNYHNDAYLHSIGSAYFKTKLINLTTLANRVKYAPNNMGSGHGWHRDSIYYKQFKSIIYLVDTTEENGPFEYLIGSHTTSSALDIIKKTTVDGTNDRLNDNDINEIVKETGIERKSFPGKAGTLILVNTRGIHRGMPIRQGTRYALTNYYIQLYQRDYYLEKWNRTEYLAGPLPIPNKFSYNIVKAIFDLKRAFFPAKV